MEYPLFIDGAEVGIVSLREDGLYTRIEAQADDGGELVRLWLHGRGESAYLGIMQKTDSGLHLVKKFSRRDMRQFPREIEYASDRGEKVNVICEERTDIPKEAIKNEAAEPKKYAEREECEEGLIWYSGQGGILTAFDGAGRLAAFPARLRGSVRGADVRCIEGREYIVFRY